MCEETNMRSLNERVDSANELIEAVWRYLASADPEVYRKLVKERKNRKTVP